MKLYYKFFFFYSKGIAFNVWFEIVRLAKSIIFFIVKKICKEEILNRYIVVFNYRKECNVMSIKLVINSGKIGKCMYFSYVSSISSS